MLGQPVPKRPRSKELKMFSNPEWLANTVPSDLQHNRQRRRPDPALTDSPPVRLSLGDHRLIINENQRRAHA
jgi:hypothetical protein